MRVPRRIMECWLHVTLLGGAEADGSVAYSQLASNADQAFATNHGSNPDCCIIKKTRSWPKRSVEKRVGES